MSRLPNGCPACGTALMVERLGCPGCAMHLEGKFDLPEFLRLSREDQDFVLAFVRCSGSLKDLGKQLGQSYPTVRNRLDAIIAQLGKRSDDVESKRRKVLDALAKGELSVKDATRKLKELES